MKEKIANFFTSEAFAVVGVSNNKHKFGYTVYRQFKDRQFKVYPVNKNYENYNGCQCFNSVKELSENVKSVVLVVPPTETEKVIKDCVGTGIQNIWMQPGSKSNNAIELANQNNISVIHDECILMFLKPVKSIHVFHRWINKIFSKYRRYDISNQID
jgi:hypothetical protein